MNKLKIIPISLYWTPKQKKEAHERYIIYLKEKERTHGTSNDNPICKL